MKNFQGVPGIYGVEASASRIISSIFAYCLLIWMGYLSKGYYTICLGSILSSILLVILYVIPFFSGKESNQDQAVFLGLNVSILSIQACGIVLCVKAYRRHETIDSLAGIKKDDPYSFNLRLSIPLTAFLFFWGSFIVVWSYASLSTPFGRLAWMKNTLQFASYVTWALKGTIGLVSGTIFIIKSLLRQHEIKPQEKLTETP